MTVEELIKELETYPKDMEVGIEIPKRKLYEPIHDFYVRKGYVPNKGHIVCLRRDKVLW